MNYKKTIDYLYSLVPAYQKVGNKALKIDLSNITKLCESINNPQNNYPTIHIGGTNGKGTVSHLIASVLQTDGKKVGLYTSPHYIDFRERVKIDGVYISQEEVITFVEMIEDQIIQIQPSFFEVTVAMAFYHFGVHTVDYAVIEVGLGGRLDSTNIITPEMSVITNIGMDHMATLGDTIAQIAGEKAGIIKPEIPVVIGEYHPESIKVFENKASDTRSIIIHAYDEWSSTESKEAISHIKDNDEYEFKKMGPFHLSNTRTALTAITTLSPEINEETVTSGINNFINNTNYKGRWQIISELPDVIFDSGHNTHAIQKSMEYLSESHYAQLHFVLGFSKDKDINGIIDYLPVHGKFYLSKIEMFRGAEVDSFRGLFESKSLDHEVYISLHSAYLAAIRTAQKDDLIFIGGSSYVVGELLHIFE